MRHYVLLLLAFFTASYAAISEKCKNPPDQLVEMCCDGVDALITEKDYDDCDFTENMKDGNLPPCNIFNCLLKKHDMLIESDSKINRNKSKDLFLKSCTRAWKPVVEQAMTKCFKELDDKKSSCEAKSFMVCFYDYTTHTCPKEHWHDTKECDNAKAFDEECGHRIYE